MVTFPFEEKQLAENVFLRCFDPNLENDELKWHIDKENRLIEPDEKTDWKIQLDNKLPDEIFGEIFIPAGVWHRIIKGTGHLKLKVTKLIPSEDI